MFLIIFMWAYTKYHISVNGKEKVIRGRWPGLLFKVCILYLLNPFNEISVQPVALNGRHTSNLSYSSCLVQDSLICQTFVDKDQFNL